MKSAGEPSGPTPTKVEAEIEGLSPLGTYHYRIVAENGSGETSLGEDQSFTSPSRTQDQGAVDRLGLHRNSPGQCPDRPWRWRHRLPRRIRDLQMLGQPRSLCQHSGSGRSSRRRFGLCGCPAVPLLGLTAGTTYHYRLVAQNSSATTDAPEAPSPPSPSPKNPSNPVPTPTSVSRPAPPASSTAAPTSWSPPPTPAAMTSSPT